MHRSGATFFSQPPSAGVPRPAEPSRLPGASVLGRVPHCEVFRLTNGLCRGSLGRLSSGASQTPAITLQASASKGVQGLPLPGASKPPNVGVFQACQERVGSASGHSAPPRSNKAPSHPNTTQALNTRQTFKASAKTQPSHVLVFFVAQAATSSQGSASKQKSFDPAHLLRRVHLFRIRFEASSQGSIGRELEASSQTQTQTLHLPGLDMSNWFWAGRLHLNKHKKPRARPSPNLEKGSTQPKLARRVHLFRIRGI